MSHTLLNNHYKEHNLFRIIDEITSVLKTLKNFLINKGFDGNKLELIIYGGSSGAHLSLLYSYMIKDPPIPIKFILNNVGPVKLNPENFLQTKPNDPPLDNIEPEDIEKALSEKKLIQMNGSATGVFMNSTFVVWLMNAWLGNSWNNSINEIFSNIETGELNKTNEKYIDLINKTSYGNPITYVTNESIPTLCLYGGKDQMIGIMHYSLLKKAFQENNNTNISLIYFKYGSHDVFENADGEYGEKMISKYKEELQNYYQKYLDSYNKNN